MNFNDIITGGCSGRVFGAFSVKVRKYDRGGEKSGKICGIKRCKLCTGIHTGYGAV